MTQLERNAMAFDAAVDSTLRLRREMDEARHSLYACADDINQAGGYAGKYLDVYLAVTGMEAAAVRRGLASLTDGDSSDDVEDALETLEAVKKVAGHA